MKRLRKPFILAIGAIVCACIVGSNANAQPYPSKPIRIVVGYVPGGAVDFTARLVGQKLSEALGQPVVIENRAGASTAIATERVATSPGDGYTLLLIPTSTAVQTALRSNLPYDLKRDLAPVSLVSIGPFVLVVHPSVPAKTPQELIALAQRQPGALNYGSSGIGSPQVLEMELLKKLLGFDMVHIGYQGGAGPAQIALLGGETQALFQPISTVQEQIKAGKMKGLGITMDKRHPLLPDVPTIGEATGSNGLADSGVWYGLSAPGGTPAAIVKKIHDDIAATLSTPELRKIIDAQGLVVIMSTPDEFATMLRDDIPKEAELMKSFGVK